MYLKYLLILIFFFSVDSSAGNCFENENYIFLAENVEFNVSAQPDFKTYIETEVVTDFAGNTMYITKKYYSEEGFIRIETEAIKEQKSIFYLYDRKYSYIWQKGISFKNGYVRKPDLEKINGFKTLIKENNESKIKELTSSELKSMDEIKFEILSVKKEHIEGRNAYCFNLILKDIAANNKRDQKIWISTDRRILKEIEYIFENQSEPPKPSVIITKLYNYDTVLPEMIFVRDRDIEYILK